MDDELIREAPSPLDILLPKPRKEYKSSLSPYCQNHFTYIKFQVRHQFASALSLSNFTLIRNPLSHHLHRLIMSWQRSNLSAPPGYDFVVATTQSSINATIKYSLQALE